MFTRVRAMSKKSNSEDRRWRGRGARGEGRGGAAGYRFWFRCLRTFLFFTLVGWAWYRVLFSFSFRGSLSSHQFVLEISVRGQWFAASNQAWRCLDTAVLYALWDIPPPHKSLGLFVIQLS